MRRLLLVVPVVLLMAACGSDDDAGSAPSPPTPSASSVPSTSGSDRTLTSVPGSVSPATGGAASPPTSTGVTGGSNEERAIADLAARQGVEEAAITTVSAEEVTWRSGAIGCPQPGFNYTQALVPGTRVILELDGKRYEYHSGGGRPIFLCENPELPVEG